MLICFSFLFSIQKDSVLFYMEKDSVMVSDFFANIPHGDWSSFDENKKSRLFNEFLKKELVYYNSFKSGLINQPKTNSKLLNRKKMLLINNYYEHLVARKQINNKDLIETKKNLKNKKYTYHLLVSFEGCTGSSSTKTKKQALADIVDLKNQLNTFSNKDSLLYYFKSFAQTFSEDPSAATNKGELGWVSWGLVVDSFQQPLFLLKDFVLSDVIETPYGFHLALVTKTGFSDYYYYPQKDYIDLAHKVSMRSLSFDSLSLASSNLDSLLFKKASFVLNSSFIDSLFLNYEEQKQTDRLFGNRGSFIAWAEEHPSFTNSVLFSYNKKGFGINWLVNRVGDLPASRIPVFKNKKDFAFFVRSLVLEDLVLASAKKQKIENTFSFKKDFLNNKKNILYNEYVSSLINNVFIDSLLVKQAYDKGVYNKSDEFIMPRRVVVSEMKFSSKDRAFSVLDSLKLCSACFDSTLSYFNGGVREPISSGGGGTVGELAFSLNVGELGVAQNAKGSYSLLRVEKFLEPTPFNLNLVYSQIERKLVKQKQDELKSSILDSMLVLIKPTILKERVGLK